MYDLYDLDSPMGRSIDRAKIKDWFMKHMSPGNFWAYINLESSIRDSIEEFFWGGYIMGYENGYKEGIGALEPDPHLDADLKKLQSDDGPGLQGIEESIDYSPPDWNEENESLVRSVKKRKKSKEDPNQLLLKMSLI